MSGAFKLYRFLMFGMVSYIFMKYYLKSIQVHKHGNMVGYFSFIV